jgi:hypothetical protein
MNPADAEWCGLCLRRFPPADVSVDPIESPADILLGEELPAESSAPRSGTREAAERRLKPAASGAFTVTETGITWTCAACDNANPLEAQVCSVCGTSFAEMLRPKPERPQRDPNLASLLSLFLPGAGHAYLGMWGQAIARGVISLWVLMVVVVSLLAAGKGSSNLVAIVFGAVGTVLWGVGAHDAFREARGEGLMTILKGKLFMYLVLGLLMLLFVLMMGAGLQARSG